MKRTNDFFGDLEGQLATAAAARATGGARASRTRSRRLPGWLRPALAYGLALTAIAVAVVGIATVTSETGVDEIPAVAPTPAPTVDPTLPDGTRNPAADCPLHPGLAKAFPAIAEPPERPVEMLPDLVAAKVRSDWRYPDLRLARRLEADDAGAGYTFYAIPIGHCPEKGLDGPSDLVVLYAFRDGTFVTTGVQLRATAGRTLTVNMQPAEDGRHIVFGSAPPAATRASVDFGLYGTAGVTVRGGLIAEVLPAEVSAEAVAAGKWQVRYYDDDDNEVPEGGDPEAGDASIRSASRVGVLNATQVEGVAAEYERDLESSGWNVVGLGNAGEPQETSTIYFTDDADKDAARVLSIDTGVKRIAAMEPQIAERVPEAKVILVAGRDRIPSRTGDDKPPVGVFNASGDSGLNYPVAKKIGFDRYEPLELDDQAPRNRTVVMFGDGHEDVARDIANRLGVDRVVAMSDEIRELDGTMVAAVVFGRDMSDLVASETP